MLERIGNMVDAATGLAKARLQMVVIDLKQAGAVAATYLGAGIVIVTGLVTLIAAGTAALAGQIGWPGALGVAGGFQLLVAGIVVLVLRSRSAEKPALSRDALENEARECADVLSSGGKVEVPEEDAPPPPPGSRQSMFGSAEHGPAALLQDPKVVGSALFAIVALLGVKRSVKLLSKVAAGAGVAASVAKTWGSISAINAAAAEQSQAFRSKAARNGHVPSGRT